jgi:hypothetical protein
MKEEDHLEDLDIDFGVLLRFILNSMGWHELDSSGPEWEQVLLYECEEEPSGCIKSGEILEDLRNSYLYKNDSAHSA